MKVGVVALACVLRLALPAQAGEAARPAQPVAQVPVAQATVAPAAVAPATVAQATVAQATTAQATVAQQQPAQHAVEPPANIRPWVDPSSAQQVGKIQPPPQPSSPVPTKAQPAPPARVAQRQRQCLNPVETRQTVAAHRLTEPVRALRAGRAEGEALRAKLCRWKQDQFVYEVFVLRRDGRIVRLYMNAQNGQAVGALDDDRQ